MHIFNTKHVKHGAIWARGGAALSKFLRLIVMKSCVINPDGILLRKQAVKPELRSRQKQACGLFPASAQARVHSSSCLEPWLDTHANSACVHNLVCLLGFALNPLLELVAHAEAASTALKHPMTRTRKPNLNLKLELTGRVNYYL